MSETPSVTQAKLNIAHNEVSEVSPGDLEPHPKNREIYGDTEDPSDLGDEFVESVESKGVLEPLTVTEAGEIISGHRRWIAAKEAGLATVPVRREDFESDLHEREALIEFNRQREKTPGQIVNEFEEILAVERERAEKRNSESAGASVEKLPQTESGKARDKAAEKVNADVSGRTLEKGKKVKDKATDESEPEEVQEAAQEAWEGLESGEESFNSAHEKVKEAEEKEESKKDIEQFTSQQTDEWSSPRDIVEPLDEAIDGFDLDPCSGAEDSPFAKTAYTEADDGLSSEWFGTVWVNPPYSEMASWTDKAVEEAQSESVDSILYLCKGDSSTDWWQAAMSAAEFVGTVDHRLKFGDGENSAPFASHIFVFGDVDEAVISELQTNGVVLEPTNTGEP